MRMRLPLLCFATIFSLTCTSSPSKSEKVRETQQRTSDRTSAPKEAKKTPVETIPFGGSDLTVFDPSPKDTKPGSISSRLQSLLEGDFDSLQRYLEDENEDQGSPGQPIGLDGIYALDVIRPHIGIASQFANHFCTEIQVLKVYSGDHSDFQTPKATPALLHYVRDPSPNGFRAFWQSKALPSGELQWRILHYFGPNFADGYVFRFDPKTRKLKQYIYTKAGFILALETPLVHNGNWIRDPTKPAQIRGAYSKTGAFFDMNLSESVVRAEVRGESDQSTRRWVIKGFWGKLDEESFPAFVPNQFALLAEEKSFAATFDFTSNLYILYPENSASRLLKKRTKSVGSSWDQIEAMINDPEITDVTGISPENATILEAAQVQKILQNPADAFCNRRLSTSTDFIQSSEKFQTEVNARQE